MTLIVELNKAKPIDIRQLFKYVFQGLTNQSYFLSTHASTMVNDTH